MELQDLVKARDVEGIRRYCKENGFSVRDGRLVPKDQQTKKRLTDQIDYWDQRQQSRKILLG